MLSLCRGIEVIVEAQLGSFKVIMLAWKVYVAQALSVGYATLQRCTRLVKKVLAGQYLKSAKPICDETFTLYHPLVVTFHNLWLMNS